MDYVISPQVDLAFGIIVGTVIWAFVRGFIMWIRCLLGKEY